jgi:small subunit ribosomal protein S13
LRKSQTQTAAGIKEKLIMSRISGVDLPEGKRIDIALTYIYGIGRSNVHKVLHDANIDAAKRVNTLTDEDTNRIAKVIEKGFKVEGDLRQEIMGNIKRLREIGSYRGYRHAHNLPVRGQRTRSNARTRRGKRVTIGAMKKDDRIKLETTAPKTPAPAASPKK